MIQKFTVSHDPDIYQAWPDVALTPSGRLVCVFAECKHHVDRSYTRIMLCDSTDRGRTWSSKRPLTEGTGAGEAFYNCPRITQMRDGRLCVVVDRCPQGEVKVRSMYAISLLYFSADEGVTWSEPVATPLHGIVPDRLLELSDGRWIISAHHYEDDFLTQFMRYSDDQGQTWSDRITVAKQAGLNLCEVSILPVGKEVLVAFMRENSFLGWDCKKTISHDRGETWGPVIDFPLPGCHRPVAGWLQGGHIMITHRFLQGGKGWLGKWTQNLFAALSDEASALATARNDSAVRILPVDFDRSPLSDTGYSGWVQFDDGEIYIVNYIVDDAIDKGQIRGYSLRMEDFVLPSA
ncbi:MAG: exo-alpha-sialidase [Lentisphaerae bacterium]|nr:exo-alpha-sialidase [Lentisphaerota bacterium]